MQIQKSLFPMMNRCEINEECGLLAIKTPYIHELVECLKSLPYTDRRYDGNRKVWLVDPKYGKQLVYWIELYAGEVVSLPTVQASNSVTVMRLLEVRYIGGCKFRDDGSSSAFGLVGKEWSVIFPEEVLRSWFESDEPEAEPSALQTLYQVLGVKKGATQDEVKSAFRRMARQWHPDVCQEPNAHEVFIRIQEAAAILSDWNKRARYDVGLKLQRDYEKKQVKGKLFANVQQNYRSPLRCGQMMVEGIEKVGRLEVSKILAWEDITRDGLTLVVSWPMGAKEPVEVWM